MVKKEIKCKFITEPKEPIEDWMQDEEIIFAIGFKEDRKERFHCRISADENSLLEICSILKDIANYIEDDIK